MVESWNKLCVVPFERVSHCSAFTENGSFLVCYINDQVEEPDFKFVLDDTETLHEKKDPDIQQHSYVATFMQSLVLLDGANMVAYYTDGRGYIRSEVISGMDELKPLLFLFLL